MSSSQSYRSIPTDRVSSLPDSIISHILSFLLTKDSIATSVLSKRWNPLWLSVLDLNFDAQTFKDYITFRHAVYLVIVSRDNALPIRSFRLKFGIEYDINRFIKAAIQRGIEELDIDMLEKVNGLTGSIFSCKTLTVLKLKNLSMKDDNCQVDLPILKVLCWGFHDKPYIAKIVSGCPILEEWQIENSAFYLRKLNPKTPNFFSRVEMMHLRKE